MRSRHSRRAGVHAGFALVALSSLLTHAIAAETDLIVRYRAPQDEALQADRQTSRLSGHRARKLEILNGSEGVVKLRFADALEAAAARERLEGSDEVLGVQENLTYHPAVRLKFRRVKAEERAEREAAALLAERERELAFLTLPMAEFATAVVSGMPEVLLPGAQKKGTDPLATKDWALANIRMPALSKVKAVKTLTAAVIDTGVDYNHEDLIAAMWRKSGNAKEVGYDFAHDNAKPFDLVNFDVDGCLADADCRAGIGSEKFMSNPGHGTHCAGHVGAVANNALGMTGVGGATQVKVMALKFFYDKGEEGAGSGDDAAAIKSIDYAVRNGAKIISASWGGRQPRRAGQASELHAAIKRARDAGVLFIVAAGNDTVNQDRDAEPSFPAAYTDLDNMIVVAASDSKDKLASFSNYGAKSVHLAAPGVKILSTTSGGGYSDVVARYKGSDGAMHEMDWDGTSMATPIVAGAAALVWSVKSTENYLQIKNRLLKNVRKVSALSGKVATGGVLDITAALAAKASR